MNQITEDAVCDATEEDSSTIADYIINNNIILKEFL